MTMTRPASASGAIARLWDMILLSLCTLNRIQFEAPWRPTERRC